MITFNPILFLLDLLTTTQLPIEDKTATSSPTNHPPHLSVLPIDHQSSQNNDSMKITPPTDASLSANVSPTTTVNLMSMNQTNDNDQKTLLKENVTNIVVTMNSSSSPVLKPTTLPVIETTVKVIPDEINGMMVVDDISSNAEEPDKSEKLIITSQSQPQGRALNFTMSDEIQASNPINFVTPPPPDSQETTTFITKSVVDVKPTTTEKSSSSDQKKNTKDLMLDLSDVSMDSNEEENNGNDNQHVFMMTDTEGRNSNNQEEKFTSYECVFNGSTFEV